MKRNEVITTTGTLYPAFDEQADMLTGVILTATDGTEYVIEGDRFIHELIGLCHHEIHITGRCSFRSGQWHLLPHFYEARVCGQIHRIGSELGHAGMDVAGVSSDQGFEAMS